MALNDLFWIGASVLSTAVDKVTNTILAQVGSIREKYVYGEGAEWYQHVGFSSRPSQPSPTANATTASECVGIKGTTDIIFASRDVRGQAIYGSLGDGETCLYATGADGTAQGRVLIKKDSSINLYTRTSSTANGMMVSLTPSNDSISLLNAAGLGIIIDPTGIKLIGLDSSLTLTSGNAKLMSKGKTQVDGSTVVLGSLVVPGVNAALTGVTGVAGKASFKVLIE
jgi:hypothetical protein